MIEITMKLTFGWILLITVASTLWYSLHNEYKLAVDFDDFFQTYIEKSSGLIVQNYNKNNEGVLRFV